MNNLVLITSIIETPNTPLSYTDTRSFYTPIERFEQTKKTIETVKAKIPNSKIFIVECSLLNEEQNEYFKTNSNYFLNLIDNDYKKNNIYSMSKSLGEGTMTISCLEYIKNNNIIVDNFFKITGRYWLSENFDYNNFNNNDIVINYIYGDRDNTNTSLYKLHKMNVDDFYNFLINNIHLMFQCIGYEVLFAIFLKETKPNNIIHLNKIGVNGYISVAKNVLVDN